MDELLEASSHLKVFIQSKTKPGWFWQQILLLGAAVLLLHWSLVTGTFRACDVDFLWFLRILRGILKKFEQFC